MLIVDRIADGIAVLEGDAGSLEVPASWLPTGAGEGTVLRLDVRRDQDTARLTLAIDARAMADRGVEIRRLRESIPEGPGGDIAL